MGTIGLDFQVTAGRAGRAESGRNQLHSFVPQPWHPVWGARTLSSDPEWRYINVRRLFNYVAESIIDRDAVERLRAQRLAALDAIDVAASNFLMRLWRSGALFGATPEQAFYVKCDEETNPPEVIEAGQVVCEIGIAPVKPAEFVIFRLSQFTGGGGEAEVEE